MSCVHIYLFFIYRVGDAALLFKDLQRPVVRIFGQTLVRILSSLSPGVAKFGAINILSLHGLETHLHISALFLIAPLIGTAKSRVPLSLTLFAPIEAIYRLEARPSVNNTTIFCRFFDLFNILLADIKARPVKVAPMGHFMASTLAMRSFLLVVSCDTTFGFQLYTTVPILAPPDTLPSWFVVANFVFLAKSCTNFFKRSKFRPQFALPPC